jgi:hypothetical protein
MSETSFIRGAGPRQAPEPAPISVRPPSSALRHPSSGHSTSTDWSEAQERANLCEAFLAHLRDGLSLRMAASAVGRSASQFSGPDSMLARYQRGGVAALLPDRRGPAAAPALGDLTAQIEALGWFLPAARYYYLLTNRTWKSGSVPEAIRRTISLPAVPFGWTERDRARLLTAIKLTALPECPEELRELILGRERHGQPLVPARIARQITATAAQVRCYRNKTDFALDYLNSPGGMRLFRDPHTGEMRLARALEIVEGDDATINFPVCVPWNRGGTPAADKYGVLVGRFQWLVFIDVGTSMVLGYSYTARPRSSYRGEDVLSAQRLLCRQHGIPQTWRFERGVWKSKLVTGAIKGMGSHLDTVYSPHQKPFIEGLFNTLWTKLSVHFPHAHVGRSQGEQESACDILTACQRGQRDPRRHFPMLSQVLGAFEEAVREKNQTPVNSAHHGRWVPAERFAEQLAAQPARRLDPESEWLFSPFVKEWTVRGMLVGGRVPIFEGMSVPFDFAAPFLPNYDGALVRAWFDPADPKCAATLCLAQPWNGQPAGTRLGTAMQVNDTAGYTRLVMGWGDDPAMAGVKARQQAAAGLRREVRGIVPAGRGAAASEERDGLGTVTRIESDSDAATATTSATSEACPPPSASARPRRGETPAAPESVEIDPERLRRSEAFQRDHALEFV